MQEQQKKKRQKEHKKIIEKIKKQVNIQQFGNLRVTYSYLLKTSGSGFSKNNRLFFLYDKLKFGYVNQVEQGKLLPYERIQDLPKKLKVQIPIEKLTKIKNQKQIILVDFKNGEKDQQWKLIASSQDLAKAWVRFVKSSARQLKEEKSNPPKDILVGSDNLGQQKKQNGKSQGLSNFYASESAQTNKKIEQKKQQQNEKQGQTKKQITPTKQKTNQKLNQQQQTPQRPLQLQNRPESQKQQSEQKQGGSKIGNQQEPINKSKLKQGQQKQKQRQKQQVPVFGHKPEISSPKVDLFVGGTSVQNQKDQAQLKNRKQTFQSLTQKLKQEYQRKKLQQNRLINEQSQPQQSPPPLSPVSIAKNIFSYSTDTKLQIQKMQREWGYQFIKSYQQFDIIEKFKIYVEAVSKKIIDEFGLEPKKRYYQPQDSSHSQIVYQINGVLFTVFLLELKEIGTGGVIDKGTIVADQAELMAAQEFQNYQYVLRLTMNKSRIRVPLTMMTHYKGFTIYSKVLVPTTQTIQNQSLLQKQLQLLQSESRISTSIFLDPESGQTKISGIQSKLYEKLARAQSSQKTFNFLLLENLKYYLPHDFNYFSKGRPYERLRWELVQDDICQDKVLLGENMVAISSRLKIGDEIRDGIGVLTQLSKEIYARLDGLAKVLEDVEEWFTNSSQLEQLMHKNGINVRYLGQLLQRIKQSWLKQLILSQICARSAKKYLFFDLQDCILNLSQSSVESIHKFQQNQLIKFLNKMLGNTHQTEQFWKQLNKQIQYDFRVSVNRSQISQVFLLQALQYHCGFRFKNVSFGSYQQNYDGGRDRDRDQFGLGMEKKKAIGNGLSRSSSKIQQLNNLSPQKKIHNRSFLFNSSSPLNSQNIETFVPISHTYSPQFTDLYQQIKSHLSTLSQQSYQSLSILLNLSRIQLLPKHFTLSSQFYTQLCLYLINWVSPKIMPQLYQANAGQIQIGQTLPSKLLYLLKFGQIRWHLKQQNQPKAEQLKSTLITHITQHLGQNSPILTQLYQIFANYYMSLKDQQKKAINYCKTIIKNQQSLLGSTHRKLADSYYLLATVQGNFNKRVEAVNSLRKAKEIVERDVGNEQLLRESQAYGEILLKMTELFLAIDYLKQAVQYGTYTIEIMDCCGNSEGALKAIEIVARCYQITQQWEMYNKLVENVCYEMMWKWKDQPSLLQKLVKICILSSLKYIAQNSPQVSQKILSILHELPQSTRSPSIPYKFIQSRIQDRSFPKQFIKSLENVQEILYEIEENNMLARWKGFQNLANKTLLNKIGINMENKGFNFIAMIQAVNIFIGVGFIEGVLTDV